MAKSRYIEKSNSLAVSIRKHVSACSAPNISVVDQLLIIRRLFGIFLWLWKIDIPIFLFIYSRKCSITMPGQKEHEKKKHIFYVFRMMIFYWLLLGILQYAFHCCLYCTTIEKTISGCLNRKTNFSSHSIYIQLGMTNKNEKSNRG